MGIKKYKKNLLYLYLILLNKQIVYTQKRVNAP